MKAIVLFAHPGKESFCHSILHEVTNQFDQEGISYEVRDLYQEQFSPVFSASDMNGIETDQIPDEIKNEQVSIRNANLLVMIYPVWWWSQPAILKGYIDRVMTNQFAFRYESTGPIGLLTDKQAIVFTTTRESAKEMEQSGFDTVMEKQVVDGILHFCGIKPVVYRNFAEIANTSEEQRKEYLAQVHQAIRHFRTPVMM
ncbi:NAD(P)H-dependent oxidoreductase [Brevibacillus daliensis]|uniref:NAD(P)H-dependent oxidoreductase n=1 Tax=Brevibacillus daliensis TaxID=2892995 RepID=UPI001E44912A|nr:NAD(P)H-dependent oxidoreductase [Brevibacillus daliensis]